MRKKWYEKNKEQIIQKQKEKITCECGAIVSTGYLSNHEKTKKHQDYMYSKESA